MTSILDEDLHGFDGSARRAVTLAAGEAGDLGHDRLGTEHLLLGLLVDERSAAGTILREAGVSLAAARAKVREAVGPPVTDQRSPALTARAKRALGRAARFARDQRASAVDGTHLLLAVLDVEGTAGQVLRGLGVDPEPLRAALSSPPDAAGALRASGSPTAPPGDGGRADPAVCPGCRAVIAGAVTSARVRVEGHPGVEVLLLTCPACGQVLGTTAGP